MLKRLPGFLTLTLLFLGVVFLPNPWGALLFAVCSAVLLGLANRELEQLTAKMGFPGWWKVSFAGGLIALAYLFLSEFFNFSRPDVTAGGGALWLVAFVTGALWFIPVFFLKPEWISKLLHTLGIFVLLTPPMLLLFYIYLMDDHCRTCVCSESSLVKAPMFLFLVAVTKIGDTGAYLFGMTANKLSGGRNHKIAPQISPNKSWEGAIGGMFCSMALSAGFGVWMPGDILSLPWWGMAIVGLVLFWGGFFGDLAESSLKRMANVKDSGKLFPGMGGALDFLDALLINPSLIFLLVLILNLTGK